MSNRNAVSRSTIIGVGLRDLSIKGATNGRAIEATLNPRTRSASLDAVKAVGDFLSGGKSKVGYDSKNGKVSSKTGKGVGLNQFNDAMTSVAFSISKGVNLGQAYSSTNHHLAVFGKNELAMTKDEKDLYSQTYDQAAQRGYSGMSTEQAVSDTLNDNGFIGALGQHSTVDLDAAVTDGTGLFSDVELEEQNMNIDNNNIEKGYPPVFNQPTTAPTKSFDIQSFIPI